MRARARPRRQRPRPPIPKSARRRLTGPPSRPASCPGPDRCATRDRLRPLPDRTSTSSRLRCPTATSVRSTPAGGLAPDYRARRGHRDSVARHHDHVLDAAHLDAAAEVHPGKHPLRVGLVERDVEAHHLERVLARGALHDLADRLDVPPELGVRVGVEAQGDALADLAYGSSRPRPPRRARS